MKKKRDNKAAIIAALVTFGVALVTLVLLFTLSLKFDREALAEASIPEIQDDEEYFLEPEFIPIEEPGDTKIQEEQEAAPQPPGEPDPAPEEQPQSVVKNLVPPPEPPVTNKPKLVSTTKESPVKTSTPKVNTEEDKRVASVAGKFKSENNGSRNGTETAASGTGGAGLATVGSVNGRKMLSCPTWPVRMQQQKTTIRVNITVNADGSVIQANAVSGGTPELRAECVKMARGSKWSKAEGAPNAVGSITFTITRK